MMLNTKSGERFQTPDEAGSTERNAGRRVALRITCHGKT